MGISDDIEVATIAIDEAKILEVNARIALPRFQLSFTILTVKKCSARSDVFLLLIFPIFSLLIDVSLPRAPSGSG